MIVGLGAGGWGVESGGSVQPASPGARDGGFGRSSASASIETGEAGLLGVWVDGGTGQSALGDVGIGQTKRSRRGGGHFGARPGARKWGPDSGCCSASPSSPSSPPRPRSATAASATSPVRAGDESVGSMRVGGSRPQPLPGQVPPRRAGVLPVPGHRLRLHFGEEARLCPQGRRHQFQTSPAFDDR